MIQCTLMGQEEFMLISNCLLMSSSSSSISSLAMSSIASPDWYPRSVMYFFCHDSTQHALQYCMSIMIILADSDSPSNMRACDICTMKSMMMTVQINVIQGHSLQVVQNASLGVIFFHLGFFSGNREVSYLENSC